MEIIVPPEDQFCKIGGKKADESCHLAENRIDLPKSAVLHVGYFAISVKKRSYLSGCYLTEKHFYA